MAFFRARQKLSFHFGLRTVQASLDFSVPRWGGPWDHRQPQANSLSQLYARFQVTQSFSPPDTVELAYDICNKTYKNKNLKKHLKNPKTVPYVQ